MTKTYYVERLHYGADVHSEHTSLRAAKAEARRLLGVSRLSQPVPVSDGPEYSVGEPATTERRTVKISERA